MYLARTLFAHPDGPQARILACNDPDHGWVDVRAWERRRLEARGATPTAAIAMAGATVPASMAAALAAGGAFWDAAHGAAGDATGLDRQYEPVLIAALDPSGYRDFMVFERHFRFGYEWRGLPVPDVMYEFPVSYFGNPLSFIGPDEEVPWPHYSSRLDYELELGIVIGKAGRDLTPEQAVAHIAGYTILNDFSARDIQMQEMAGGLGPSKGKHFACGSGPYLVTADSIAPDRLRMQARVNGEIWCDATSAEMIWSVAEIVAWASQAEELVPGMLLGTGTCNGGSTVEINRHLRPGDAIELEIEGLGTLRNRLGQPATAGWWPEHRVRS